MGNVSLGAPAPDSLQLQPLRSGLPADSLRSAPQPAKPAPLARDQARPGSTPAKGHPAVAADVGKQLASAPKPAAPARPLHVTEFYSMTGDLIDAFETTSRFSRIMVDEKAYGEYLKAKFASLNPDVPVEATQLVDGVVAALNQDEAATKTDLIATESKLSLHFAGEALERTMGSITRQYGEGQLEVVSTFDNGKEAVVAAFDAVSGPMRNGLIPNGRYKVTAPVDAVNQFPDETGTFGFKMPINPLERMERSAFRIHSVQSKAKKLAWMTEGCVGLSGGHDQNVRFHALMQDYFRNRKSIDLNVAIVGNANVKRQLGDNPSYR